MVFEIIGIIVALLFLFSIVRAILVVIKFNKMAKEARENPEEFKKKMEAMQKMQGYAYINGEMKPVNPEEMEALIKQAMGEAVPPQDVNPVTPIVIDPICGKEVEKGTGYRVVKDGQEYEFCSWECREKFLKGNQDTNQDTNIESN